jgi:hypothetical protein
MDDWYESIFSISEIEDEPKSEEFELVGYESMIVMSNMGSLFLFYLMIWVKQIIILILSKVVPNFLLNGKLGRLLK